MNKSLLVFVASILFCSLSFAQGVTFDHARKGAQNHYKAADNAYAFGRYAIADSLLRLAIES